MSFMRMGHMRRWWIFGFEWWGRFRPAIMWTASGEALHPLVLGVWIRCPEFDEK